MSVVSLYREDKRVFIFVVVVVIASFLIGFFQGGCYDHHSQYYCDAQDDYDPTFGFR